MTKKLTRTIAGVMSLMFVGQIMVFGDGASQGILHADTIASAAEAIEGAKNKDQLAKEFEEATKGLGEVDYFELPESVEQNIMTYSSRTEAQVEAETESASDFTWDFTAKSYIQYLKEATGVQDTSALTITGKVQKGTVNGHAASDNTPIYVRIFDGDWNEIESWEVSEGEEYTATVTGSRCTRRGFRWDRPPEYPEPASAGTHRARGRPSLRRRSCCPCPRRLRTALRRAGS